MSEKKAKHSEVLKLTITAMLLAVCMVSQVFKNLSVYITGPVVNTCLVLCMLTAGLKYALLLALITPVTAYFISAAPVMTAVPGIVPLIMAGNVVLVVVAFFFVRPTLKKNTVKNSVFYGITSVIAAGAKGAFMGLTISLWLLPTFLPEASPLRKKLGVFQTMFSLTQFVTALIGFVYLFVVWQAVKKFFASEMGE
ncbi:MAG: ECF transporter S component [Lachnospiraceae bacterium]|nr:ECF transporter S component [Lachnospiraceae bacterium]